MAKKNLADVLVDLQATLEETVIFDILPHYERWEDGLESLDKARKQITRIKAVLEHTPGAPRALVMDVARIHGMLSDFVKLRDNFRDELPNGGDSHDWSQRRVAERQLEELQRVVRDLKSKLRAGEFISGSGEISSSSMEWRWFGIGAVMLMAALVFAGWGFSLRTLEPDQRRILLWVLPLASGFAAGAFAGSFSVRARDWIPGLIISATGGFGVWLISSYLLFPREDSAPRGGDDVEGLSALNVALTTEKDTDRYGNDYRNISNVTHEQCRSICLADKNCEAYTYDGNPGSNVYRHCYLKSPAPPPAFKKGDVSGVKQGKNSAEVKDPFGDAEPEGQGLARKPSEVEGLVENQVRLNRERTAGEVLAVLREAQSWDRERTFKGLFENKWPPLPGWLGVVEGEPRIVEDGKCNFLFIESGTRTRILAKESSACNVRNRDRVTVDGPIIGYHADMLEVAAATVVLE